MSGTAPKTGENSSRIVTTPEVLGGDPRIAGSRISVLFVHERVEGRGLEPQTVADRHDLDVADVYRALAYYHEHPREMERLRRERTEAFESFRETLDRPDGVSPE